jgi:threonine synthase
MHYISTRNPAHRVTLSQAIAQGIAPDGGLYIPDPFPHFVAHQFSDVYDMPEIGERLLSAFAEGDPLQAEIGNICREAFNFPTPVVPLENAPSPASVLELFHGPTSAFKDYGARFLAATLARIRRGAKKKLTILVATSGDTGGAVAAAFHRRPEFNVVVLYPKRSSLPVGATT